MSPLWLLVPCVISVTTGEFVVAGLLPQVAEAFGVPVGRAGLTITAYAFGMIVGGPLVTALTAQADRRGVMIALLLVASVGNLASALAPAFPVLLAARVLTGLTTSTFFAQAIVVSVRSRPPEHAARTVATLALGMTAAMVAGAPLGVMIADLWGWRSTFVVLGAATLLSCLVLVLGLRLAPEPGRRSALSELRELGRPRVLVALGHTVLGAMGVLMVMNYLAPLLTTVAGFPPSALAGLMLAYGLGAALGNLAGGFLHDRFPRGSAAGLLLVLAGALLAAWGVAGHPWATVAAVVAIGALGFALVPGMQARVLAAADAAPTLAVAVNASGYQLAVAAAGLLGGVIVDSPSGGATALFPAAAALTLLAAAALLAAPRARPLSAR